MCATISKEAIKHFFYDFILVYTMLVQTGVQTLLFHVRALFDLAEKGSKNMKIKNNRNISRKNAFKKNSFAYIWL